MRRLSERTVRRLHHSKWAWLVLASQLGPPWHISLPHLTTSAQPHCSYRSSMGCHETNPANQTPAPTSVDLTQTCWTTTLSLIFVIQIWPLTSCSILSQPMHHFVLCENLFLDYIDGRDSVNHYFHLSFLFSWKPAFQPHFPNAEIVFGLLDPVLLLSLSELIVV